MTRRRSRSRRSSRGRMVVRLLVVVAALTGLFAMHGLGDHGAPSQEMAAVMHPAVTAISHVDHAADATLGETGVALAVAAAPDEDSSGMAMAGLCLAILGGAVIGLLRLRRRPAVVLIRATALALAAALPSARRDRDPPCLFQLSVLRT